MYYKPCGLAGLLIITYTARIRIMPKATKESPKKAAPKKGGVKKAKKEKDPNAPKKYANLLP